MNCASRPLSCGSGKRGPNAALQPASETARTTATKPCLESMCASIGYEGLCAHQSWRVLADRLAAAGLPTLRFDYPGEGDSLGDPADPAIVDAWREQIRLAVRWMREVIGVREVALVGLRLGATLAAEVGGVERLAQIAPVVKGSSYLRELKMMARVLAASGATPEASIAAATSGDDIHLEGFTINQPMSSANSASPAPIAKGMRQP